ncbi:MAG: S1/P1 nuclease [Proteobacteria bacterium]|nr:S1/P1 nuclease [Pseudomonadota bacterium]
MPHLVLLLLVALLPSTSFAWGWEGHKLICGLAETRLTPEAKAMVNRLLEDGADLKEGVVPFAESCLWADDVKYSTRKDTYEHHFINVPDDAWELDYDRDCTAIHCTAVGVQQALHYLASDTDGDRAVTRRAAALRYLGDYIGDMHQPLHVGNASDWGGNRIRVKWYLKDANLHGIWDYEMLDTMGYKYPDTLEFLSTVEVKDPGGSVADWFQESLTLARTHAYVDTRNRIIKSGDQLGNAYLNRNKPVVIERLVLAADRLASLLNQIAAGEKPRAFRIAPLTD